MMTKKVLTCLGLMLIAGSSALMAQEYKFAAGIRLSNATPTISNSISAKYFLNETEALEALVSFGGRFGVGLLYEKHKPLSANAPGFQWFYGAGAYVGFQGGDTYLGPTGVIGLDYKFPDVPLCLSLDWKPELDIIPKVNLIPDAFGFTARFTFNGKKDKQ